MEVVNNIYTLFLLSKHVVTLNIIFSTTLLIAQWMFFYKKKNNLYKTYYDLKSKIVVYCLKPKKNPRQTRPFLIKTFI